MLSVSTLFFVLVPWFIALEGHALIQTSSRRQSNHAEVSPHEYLQSLKTLLRDEIPHHRRIFDMARWAGYDCQSKGEMLEGYANATLLEIGAHDGEEIPQFNTTAAHIWTFEPSPDKAIPIKYVIAANHMESKTDFFPMAVSDVDGKARFWVDGSNSQQNTVGKPPPWVSQELFNEQAIEVPVATLDHIWEHILFKQHVTMLKMDTQGHELRILKGATRFLEADPPDIIHTELAPNLMKQAGSNATEYLRLLYDVGYICFDCQKFHPPGLDPAARDIDNYEHYFENFTFKGVNHGQWADLVCLI